MPFPIVCLFLIDLLFGGIYAIHRVKLYTYSPEIFRLFDLDREANLSTWFSSFQLSLVALLFFVFFHYERVMKQVFSWALLFSGLLFLFLSIDETGQIHELIGFFLDSLLIGGDREGANLRYTGVWMLVLGPILIAFLIYLFYKLRHYLVGHSKVLILYGTGFVLLLFSTLVLELAVNFFESWYPLIVLMEEVGEMAGVTFIIWGTTQLLADHKVILKF